jgi:hypothetical protein
MEEDEFDLPAFFEVFDLGTLVDWLFEQWEYRNTVREYFAPQGIYSVHGIVVHIRKNMATNKLSLSQAFYPILKNVLDANNYTDLFGSDCLQTLYSQLLTTVAQKTVSASTVELPGSLLEVSDSAIDLPADSNIMEAMRELSSLAKKEVVIHIKIAQLLWVLRARVKAKEWHKLSEQLEHVLSYAPSDYCEFILTVPQGLLDLDQASFRMLTSVNCLLLTNSKALNETPEGYLMKVKKLKAVSSTFQMMEALQNKISTPETICSQRTEGIASVSVRI